MPIEDPSSRLWTVIFWRFFAAMKMSPPQATVTSDASRARNRPT